MSDPARTAETSANVGLLLRGAALRWPERVAVVDVDPDALPGHARPTTWSALALAAERVAGSLRAGGLGPGDTVGLLGHNAADLVAAWFGVALAGCVIAPLSTASAPAEVQVRSRLMRALIVDDACAPLAAHADLGADQILPLRALTTAAVTPAGPAEVARPASVATQPGDPALLLFTSGTTTAARGALMSHRTLVTHTTNVVAHALRLTPADVVLGALPLSHSFGCRMVMLACAVSGARMVLLPRFSAAWAADVMQREGVTWLPAVPTMLAGFVRLPAPLQLPALRWCLSAGATLPEPQRLRACRALGAPVYQGYGMTEATFSALDHPPAPPTPGSVGRAAPGVAIRVVDAEGRSLPVGARGEVRVRGANLFSGYLNDPAETARVLHQGEVRSGDIGVVDEAGRLRIVDRARDLILRGGHSVFPSEVEAALLAHPGIHQVAVVGVPHAALGEEIVAVLVAGSQAPDDHEISAWVDARLGRYKQPRALVWVDALPMGPSRKVLKRALRQQLASGALLARPLQRRTSATTR